MTATTQSESTASAHWMEHQVLQHIKSALRVTLQWEAPPVSMPRKLSSMRFTMKSFQRHLERAMRLEEEGGYLNVVVETKPYLCNRLYRLAHDHDRFRRRIKRLVPELDGLSEWDEGRFDEVCDEIQSLLDEVDRHSAAEVELLQETLLSDVGGEG